MQEGRHEPTTGPLRRLTSRRSEGQAFPPDNQQSVNGEELVAKVPTEDQAVKSSRDGGTGTLARHGKGDGPEGLSDDSYSFADPYSLPIISGRIKDSAFADCRVMPFAGMSLPAREKLLITRLGDVISTEPDAR